MTLESDKVRCLLAALAVDVGRRVSLETLIVRLWDDEPPAKARATAHSYLSRLRTALRSAQSGDGGRPTAAISRQAHGYTLETDPDRVDWMRYVQLSRRARTLAEQGDDRQALAVLGHAEDAWQGEPLAGLPGQWARATRNTMRDQWLATTLTRFEVELRLGRFVDLVPELAALAEQRPADERVAGHLMTALHGCGRQAEALSVFQRTRRQLRDQLGIEPGEQLGLLHQRILRRIPISAILTRPSAHTGRAPGQPAPVQRCSLPPLPRLVGRDEELQRILAAADAGSPEGETGAVASVSGMAGVGKSCIALTAAHLLRNRFPDGQHYVDLRANGGAQQPLPPAAVATALLRRFGVPASDIPLDPDELTSRCRDLLSEHRAVVVLDDAAGPRQIRPLLPTSPSCFILITSRHRLAELPSTPLVLDVLPSADAIELFTRLVGPDRADDPETVEVVTTLCDRLPLAIELAASRFRAHPSWSLTHLVQRLSRKSGRLGELRHGLDSVPLAFEMSYQSLPAEQQQAFRRLGLHPGPDFGPDSAAALIGQPLPQTDRVLENLLDLHMVQENLPERYRLHDLLREYAEDLVTAEERDRALRRLIDFALQATDRADRIIHARRFRLPLPATPGGPTTDGLADRLEWPDEKAAKDWLTAEQLSLAAVENHARTAGMAEEAAWLAHVLAGHLEAEGLWREAGAMHRAAADHWHTQGVSQAETHALIALASVLLRAAHYPAAAEAIECALGIARSNHDSGSIAEALDRLAMLHWHHSDLTSALSLQREVLEIRRNSGDDWNHARCLNNIGIIHLHMGDHGSALTSFTEAHPLARRLNDLRLEMLILNNLGGLHLSARNPEAARGAFERILTVGDGVLPPHDLATVRINLAAALRLPDETDRAAELYHSALHAFRDMGSRRLEADAMNGLATVHRAAGKYPEALDQHTRALELSRAIGAQREEAGALRGLGQTAAALDHTRSAVDHLSAAVALARRIQAPDEEARSCEALAELQLHLGLPLEAQTSVLRAIELTESINAPESESLRKLAIEIDQANGGISPI